MKNYEWNKESFLNFIEKSKAKVEIINGQAENTVLLRVKNYDTMNKLFYGRTSWSLTTSESQWKNYVSGKKGNKQYVWVNFNVKENKGNAFIGFTVSFRPNETFVYAAHDKDDYTVSSVRRDHTIETLKQGLINEGINLEPIFKTEKLKKNVDKFENGIVIIDNITIGVAKMIEGAENNKPYPSVRVELTNGINDIALTYEDANILLEKIKRKETVIIGENEGGKYDTVLSDYKFNN